MGQIILVRHGQTDWNTDKRFRGLADVELNDKGVEQARNLAKRLSAMAIAAVYSSPIKRALKTAEIIAEPHHLPIRIEPGFSNVDYGLWQGLTLEEISQEFPILFQQWLEEPQRVSFPNGESIADIGRRALEALQRLAKKHQQENIVIVAHQAINKIILFELFGLKSRLWEIPQDVAAINIIEYGGKDFKLKVLNDTTHLQKI